MPDPGRYTSNLWIPTFPLTCSFHRYILSADCIPSTGCRHTWPFVSGINYLSLLGFYIPFYKLGNMELFNGCLGLQDSYAEIPILRVMVLRCEASGRWLGHEGVALTNRISALIKDLIFLPPGRTQWADSQLWVRSGSYQTLPGSWTLQPPGLWKLVLTVVTWSTMFVSLILLFLSWELNTIVSKVLVTK